MLKEFFIETIPNFFIKTIPNFFTVTIPNMFGFEQEDKKNLLGNEENKVITSTEGYEQTAKNSSLFFTSKLTANLQSELAKNIYGLFEKDVVVSFKDSNQNHQVDINRVRPIFRFEKAFNRVQADFGNELSITLNGQRKALSIADEQRVASIVTKTINQL